MRKYKKKKSQICFLLKSKLFSFTNYNWHNLSFHMPLANKIKKFDFNHMTCFGKYKPKSLVNMMSNLITIAKTKNILDIKTISALFK